MRLWFLKDPYNNALFSIYGNKKKELLSSVDWLRSSEGEGIGGVLLDRARKLWNRPVVIRDDAQGSSQYLLGRHEIGINFPQLNSLEEWTKDGAIQRAQATLEEVLAHELTHAGQNYTGPGADRIYEKIEKSLLTPAEHTLLQKAEHEITNAATYHDALQAIERYVDVKLPINQRLAPLLATAAQNDADAVVMLQMEAEAMSYQNRVRELQGRKPINDYFNPGFWLSPDAYRDAVRQEVASKFYYQYAFKPGNPFERFQSGGSYHYPDESGLAAAHSTSIQDVSYLGRLASLLDRFRAK